MLPEQCHIALKEWAVTVRAMARGQQIVLLRKGGIHESGKDFRVIHPEFLLYPTYEHQRVDLLKLEHQPALRELLRETQPEEHVIFSHWAKVAELIEVSRQEKVDDLSPHYIWTSAYAQSRLHWKPMLPLSVLLLRVYELAQPVSLPVEPEYRGCTSWVEVLSRVNLGRMRPVLSDEEFQRRADEVKGSLGMAAAHQ